MTDATPNINHKYILMFLYYAGLRVNELVNLKVTDIDYRRDRTVFLHPRLKEDLKTTQIYTHVANKDIKRLANLL